MTSLVQVWSNQKTKNHSLSNILIYPVFKNMVQITEIMTSTRSVHPTRKPRSSGLGVTIVMPLTQVVPPTLLFYFIFIKKKWITFAFKIYNVRIFFYLIFFFWKPAQKRLCFTLLTTKLKRPVMEGRTWLIPWIHLLCFVSPFLCLFGLFCYI